ncbi:MAG: PQQ-binding-like beta-propeller repeat protein [Planctomycetia bacterium]|nr:PQQ-binding-like beta-propeller repeat protein [Planctomycetia bacterium]
MKRSKAGLGLRFLLLLACGVSVAWGQDWRGGILPQTVANSNGLHRVWVNQIQIAPGTDRLLHMIIDRGILFTVTQQGSIQATDAETGVKLWAASISSKGRMVQGLSASQYYVGFTCGSTLYIFNRANGRQLLDVEMETIPSVGLVLGETRAYVPCINGIVYAYDLKPMADPFEEFGISDSHLTQKEREARRQEFINSLRLVKSYKAPVGIRTMGDMSVTPTLGRTFHVMNRPGNDPKRKNEDAIEGALNHEYIAWPTASQVVTICDVDMRNATADERFNVSLMGEIRDSLSYRPYREKKGKADPTTGILYAGTTEGFVYAIREQTGQVIWRFPTGEQVWQTPVYVDNDLFVITVHGGMFCVDAITGGDGESTEAKWWSPGIRQFVSCSKNRVYAIDQENNLVILDRMSGQKISSISVPTIPNRLTNIQSDRIYLATERGMIQCLRESGLEKPLDYVSLPQEEKKPQLADVNLGGEEGEEAAEDEEDVEEEFTDDEESDDAGMDEEESAEESEDTEEEFADDEEMDDEAGDEEAADEEFTDDEAGEEAADEEVADEEAEEEEAADEEAEE